MLRTLLVSAALSTVALAQDPTQTSEAAGDKVVFVKMSTTAGDIILELDNAKAPISVANFLKYADAKAYEGTIFHRVIPWFVIQGGGHTPDFTELKGEPAIKNEWINGLKNVRGSIAMARDAEPDTATRQFFINTADNPKLDTSRPATGNAGYAVFGRVICGMDVVDQIRDGVTGSRPDPDPEKAMDDVPTSPVSITGVSRLSIADAQAKAAEAKPGREPWKFWRFEEPLDAAPPGFTAAETAGKGALAQWRITKPPDAVKPASPPAAIRCITSNSGSTYNLLLADGTSYRDLSLTVRVHAESGEEDQGGGVVWRAKDADNYYIARWNPIEGNFRVYHVKAGKRTQLGSAEVSSGAKEWHRIRIDHTGTKIAASFDGRTVINVEDSTFPDAGKIGLWTKADAGTWFDDLAVTATLPR
jgi:cyclophilin family peptidyl-prolyl cis-trans isomerase